MAALVWRVPGHVYRPQVNFHGCCLYQIADPAVTGERAYMPSRLTYILLSQNHGSKDNKDCTCTFNDYGNLIEANPACPVQGHRYFRQTLFSRFRRNAFSKATPQGSPRRPHDGDYA